MTETPRKNCVVSSKSGPKAGLSSSYGRELDRWCPGLRLGLKRTRQSLCGGGRQGENCQHDVRKERSCVWCVDVERAVPKDVADGAMKLRLKRLVMVGKLNGIEADRAQQGNNDQPAAPTAAASCPQAVEWRK